MRAELQTQIPTGQTRHLEAPGPPLGYQAWSPLLISSLSFLWTEQESKKWHAAPSARSETTQQAPAPLQPGDLGSTPERWQQAGQRENRAQRAFCLSSERLGRLPRQEGRGEAVSNTLPGRGRAISKRPQEDTGSLALSQEGSEPVNLLLGQRPQPPLVPEPEERR